MGWTIPAVRLGSQEGGEAGDHDGGGHGHVGCAEQAGDDVQDRQDENGRHRTGETGEPEGLSAMAGPSIGEPAAGPVADCEPGQHDADHRRPRIERHPEKRGQHAPGDDLDDHRPGSIAGNDEHQGDSEESP